MTAATSGNGNLVFGDNTGNVHLVSRTFDIKTFRAYEVTLTLACQVQHSSYLFTVGVSIFFSVQCNQINYDTLAIIYIHFKIFNRKMSQAATQQSRYGASQKWITSQIKLHSQFARGLAERLLVTELSLQQPSAFTLALPWWLWDLKMAQLFFTGMSILCFKIDWILSKIINKINSYRGDLTRERKSKTKVLKDTNTPITGLAIKLMGKQNYLFVSTTTSIFLYNITVKDKETKTSLDNMGCERKCGVLAESIQDSHFMIGRNDVCIQSTYLLINKNFSCNLFNLWYLIWIAPRLLV